MQTLFFPLWQPLTRHWGKQMAAEDVMLLGRQPVSSKRSWFIQYWWGGVRFTLAVGRLAVMFQTSGRETAQNGENLFQSSPSWRHPPRATQEPRSRWTRPAVESGAASEQPWAADLSLHRRWKPEEVVTQKWHLDLGKSRAKPRWRCVRAQMRAAFAATRSTLLNYSPAARRLVFLCGRRFASPAPKGHNSHLGQRPAVSRCHGNDTLLQR